MRPSLVGKLMLRQIESGYIALARSAQLGDKLANAHCVREVGNTNNDYRFNRLSHRVEFIIIVIIILIV